MIKKISCSKPFLESAHFLVRADKIFYHRRKKSMILNFGAREFLWYRIFYLRAPRNACAPKFFQHDILWSILYILGIFKILISFKLIAVDAFEYWVFSWKIQKKIEFFKIFKFSKLSEKIEFSKKISDFKLL